MTHCKREFYLAISNGNIEISKLQFQIENVGIKISSQLITSDRNQGTNFNKNYTVKWNKRFNDVVIWMKERLCVTRCPS